MKFFLTTLAIGVLTSCSAFARPAVKVNIDTEIHRVDKMMETIKTHQQNFWAIGLHGETMRPDAISRFFFDRDLTFNYFVRSMSGVQLGDVMAYNKNLEVLMNYKKKIIAEEIEETKALEQKLKDYNETVTSPGFTAAELPNAEDVLSFYAEHRLPVSFRPEGTSINVADEASYEANQKRLEKYLSDLEAMQKSIDMK